LRVDSPVIKAANVVDGPVVVMENSDHTTVRLLLHAIIDNTHEESTRVLVRAALELLK
jgi:hypothetical protein